MCRHVAYLGAARPLRELLYDAPHALVDQGRTPREMVVAKDNPDGWGIAWWADVDPTPRRYRTTTTMWEDTAFSDAGCPAPAALGAVRKASPHTTRRAVNNAPFLSESRVGPIAFSLNGYAFQGGSEGRIRNELAPGADLEGDTDSEVLFHLLRTRLDAGADLPRALAAVHHIVDPSKDAYVNLLAMTRDQIAATTWQHSLYQRRTDDASFTVVSEPVDLEEGWERVPDAHLLVADRNGVTTSPLEGMR